LTNVPKVVDLGNLTETIVQGLTEKATTKGLRLVYSAANTASANSSQKKIMPVYYVNQDNDHIREILDNLIENAIKYTPQGEVVVDINGDEDKVIVSIKDSGLGIPPEDIPHLFQKFYRVSNMDRQEIGGTGLGLYLVRRLTENMQGRVWVESIFGQGSTFFFQLPRVDTQEAEHLQQEQQARAAQQQAVQPVAPITTLDQIPASNAVPVPYAAPAPVAAPAPTQAPQQAPAPVPTFAQPPQVAPIAAPAAMPVAPPQAAPAPSGARPATTVPRGESLTREQINERVKQLEALSQQQRGESGR